MQVMGFGRVLAEVWHLYVEVSLGNHGQGRVVFLKENRSVSYPSARVLKSIC